MSKDPAKLDYARPLYAKRPPPRRWKALACYGAMLVLVAYLDLVHAPYGRPLPLDLRVRNFLRCTCGPAHLLLTPPADTNQSLLTLAAILWTAWLAVILFTPLYRLPWFIHAGYALAWLMGGYWGVAY